MSLYSTEPNNLAQHTEGFECGLNVNDNLHMLSDTEQELYSDAKKPSKKVEQAPAPSEDDTILDDSIYEEPMGHVTFADSGLAPVDAVSDIEEFNNGSIIDTIKGYLKTIISFLKANWIIIAALLAFCLYYCYTNNHFPFMNNITGSFKLTDSSSFKASSSSLGSNVIGKNRF